jgi:hypothetical protein
VTTICGGGTSSPKPTSPAQSFFVGADLADLISFVFGEASPWVDIVVFAAAQTIDWSTLCATDPPSVPTFTATEIAEILTNPIAPTELPWQKLSDLVLIAAWYYGCQCDGLAAPTPPAGPTYPTGAPSLTSPTIAPSISGHCWDQTNTITVNDALGGNTQVDITAAFLPTGTPVTTSGGAFPLVTHAYPIPTGLSGGIHSVTTCVINPNTVTDIRYVWWTSALAYNGQSPIYTDVSNTHTVTVTPPAGTAYYALVSGNSSVGSTPYTVQITGHFTFDCTTQPPGTIQQPCCPPDSSLSAQLQVIQNLVLAIYQGLPTPITSYADGTAHAGLSGGGTITLAASVLAARVTITTDSAQLGQSAGDPTYLFDRGYVVPIVNSAPVRGETQVVYNPQLFLLPALTEQIGYYFHPGIVATITELVKGP